MSSLVRVVTSAQAAARDAAAIASGIPSRALMQRAGAAAAGEIAARLPDALARGALVYAGPGNNGGDAWVVARALEAAGVRVAVREPVEAKTPDARAERTLGSHLASASGYRGEGIVVDGLLGTGSSGVPRGGIADAVREIEEARSRGATVVALDLPTGVDASSGEAALAVRAALTITFGTLKRGHLVARERCGEIVVVDIGLGAFAHLEDGAPSLVDERWVANVVPGITASAHKGTRRKLAIVGGAEGMAGAAVLAARAAMRSGIGMVRLVVAPASLAAVQRAEPLALAAAWPDDDTAMQRDIVEWADAVVAGPGLGRSDDARAMLDALLRAFRGPAVLDADALNLIAADTRLREPLAGRRALLTPHATECARLHGGDTAGVLANRFEIGGALAKSLGATILLKGVPTVVSSPDGRVLVSAAGSPVLAAAGSGDILAGIAGTLVAQLDDDLAAGGAAAWIHGRAAERAGPPGRVRGLTLDDVLGALAGSWTLEDRPAPYPVLLELPAVGEAQDARTT